MPDTTTIEWTATRLEDGTVLPGFTFNPWTGCTKVSPACRNCYAEGFARRNSKVFGQWGPGSNRKRTSDANWRKPLKWNREAETAGIRRKVFCASMADVFEDRPELEPWRLDLWRLIEQTPHLDWLLLTKRTDVMAKWAKAHGWPANAWAGTTVEDQQRADERIPHLLRVPADVRFLSCEPLLGPLDLHEWLSYNHGQVCCSYPLCGCGGQEDAFHGIDWVIAGGESGPNARPSHPDWFTDLAEQCEYAHFFFKQWGAWGPRSSGHHIDNAVPRVKLDETGRNTATDVVVAGVPGLGTGHSPVWMNRVGKKRAGRQLDGRTWDQVPEATQ